MRSDGGTLEITGGCCAETWGGEHGRETQEETERSDKDKREHGDYI